MKIYKIEEKSGHGLSENSKRCVKFPTREMLYRESFEATYCREDWKRLQDKFEGGAE
jgi:hypothetical protein